MRPVSVVAEAEMAILARMVIMAAREPVAVPGRQGGKTVVLLAAVAAAVPALVVTVVTAVLVAMVAPLRSQAALLLRSVATALLVLAAVPAELAVLAALAVLVALAVLLLQVGRFGPILRRTLR